MILRWCLLLMVVRRSEQENVVAEEMYAAVQDVNFVLNYSYLRLEFVSSQNKVYEAIVK